MHDVSGKALDDVAVWLPAVRAGTGTDVFTRRLCQGLNARGIRAEITWLPLRAEYLPWTVMAPKPPEWSNVVHVNTWLHPRFVPRNLPVVATLHHSVHDPALYPYKGWLRAAYHRYWIAPNERRVMRRGQIVMAVSRFAADTARKTLCDVPMRVIHNGIDTARFRPAESRVASHHPFRLLYIGSWRFLKGVNVLASIMRELGDNFVLHFTGDRAAEADKLAMPPNMIDVGRLSSDRVVEAMQQADAFLFPSRSEGFGLVVAEAMACGLPVVATRGSSLPEIVEHGVTGLLCPQDDVSAFVEAIRRLATDPATWRAMSSNAVARARGRFSEDATLDAYCGIYRDAVARFAERSGSP
ncbi:MAG: glycosyltransferase family 4 protein [Thiomonas delicata]